MLLSGRDTSCNHEALIYNTKNDRRRVRSRTASYLSNYKAERHRVKVWSLWLYHLQTTTTQILRWKKYQSEFVHIRWYIRARWNDLFRLLWDRTLQQLKSGECKLLWLRDWIKTVLLPHPSSPLWPLGAFSFFRSLQDCFQTSPWPKSVWWK